MPIDEQVAIQGHLNECVGCSLSVAELAEDGGIGVRVNPAMVPRTHPLASVREAFNAVFWDASPYLWPVVGWPSDIPTYSLAQANAYFATYYAPNNLTGVLVGDFKTAEVLPLLERYFGRIPRGTVEPPPACCRCSTRPPSRAIRRPTSRA